jgi:hypothetical protein
VNPNCVDPNTGAFISNSTGGQCGTGSQLEFPPVHDMHLGIVTSALGSRLGDLCDPTAMATDPFTNVPAHNDDQGHLIARSLTYGAGNATATEGTVNGAVVASYTPSPSGFLYWFPNGTPAASPVRPETTAGAAGTAGTLIGDFGSMVGGVGIWGCGIESQLESWYRFLVQPDPYLSLTVDPDPTKMWAGVDSQILQQRKDFLRPDSLVAVIVLTDENDSEIDVRSLGGQGYFFMSQSFAPPKGTAACASDPANGACVSCSINPSDSACAPTGGGGPGYATYSAPNDWGYDPNLRHVHMKAKYGVDPQYPIQRYVIGLQSANVPDRFGEYQDAKGNPSKNYVGINDCTNPLFAAQLPDGSDLNAICKLPVGVRTKDRIFFAIIGGVPNELLHFDPTSDLNSQLNDDDWVRILGKGPAGMTLSSSPSYDYTGIDPHMIEDYRDRTTVNYPFQTDPSKTNMLVPSSAAPTGMDPVNGREWVTDQEQTAGTHVLRVDRQYACTFPLTTPRDCTLKQNSNACDCPLTATGLTPGQLPPLCSSGSPTQQIAAKAYPTTRELLVARLMRQQGIVSSLCPIDVQDNAQNNDPKYGYRPAVATIVNRLKNALNNACLPEKLIPNADQSVPCLVLVTLPPDGQSTCLNPSCDNSKGLFVPTEGNGSVLKGFCDAQEQAWMAAGGKATGNTDPATQSVCALQELVNGTGNSGGGIQFNPNDFDSLGSCTAATENGWCYTVGAKGCAQQIEFSNGSPPQGAVASLQCIYAGDAGM